MTQILLTGSTGLIGATLYKQLATRHQIARLGRRTECEIQADLSKPDSLGRIDLRGFSTIVHCAGVTDEDFTSDPAAAFIQSTVALATLMKRAVGDHVSEIIYFSTSHVYGPQEGLISEDSCTNPLSDYAIAHYAAEQILRRYSSRNIRVLTLRPNAVFGMPLSMETFDRWNLIPYSFPLEAVYRQKIVLRSSGAQRRNFVGTEDLACGVMDYLASPQSHTNQQLCQRENYAAVNPIGRETLSVYDFALRCAAIYDEMTGKPCVVERPETAGLEAPDFEYHSRRWQPGTADLNNFLITLMRRIEEDLANGRIYAA
jgi:UDP-glucose 4-epimerase